MTDVQYFNLGMLHVDAVNDAVVADANSAKASPLPP